ncbi:MAG TPA: NAD-dependent epimerase/dehydratase family protein [Ktedonobacterales bacterium]
MRVLVTGGTGFLGQHTCARLLSRGDHVLALGRTASAERVPRGIEPVPVDLCDRAAVIAACRGVDAVVHTGALSAPWGPASAFHAVNVGGTANVIEGCLRHNVPRLVYISSPSVIFDGHDHLSATESMPYPAHFTSTYALTKKQGEDLVHAAEAHIETVILRPKALFGPGDNALLPRLIAVARRGRLPQIGDGHNLVDLTYVENAAQAISLALTSRAAVGKTFHITNDEHVLLWGAIRDLLRQMGLPQPARTIPLARALVAASALEAVSTVTRREPLLTRYSVMILAQTQTYDISAARRDLGYRPEVAMGEAIARTVASLRADSLALAAHA